jgi:tetratricopeptide (TPR) repeat protein
MENDPRKLEEKANKLLAEEKYSQAYPLFKKASQLYREKNNLKEATLCATLAASCWSIISGEKRFHNAALLYEQAAKDALKCGDFEYASLLYKQAAINYERDRELISLSDCLYNSREAYRRFLSYRLFKPSKIHTINKTKNKKGLGSSIKMFFVWLMLSFSCLIWGHGERPSRTLLSCLVIIIGSAVLYSLGYTIKEGIISRPNLSDALYFSVITFSTVGFGDVTAAGLTKIVVMIESVCGIFIMPLFIVGFSRKYLRI